jgi:hypothetical protein
MDYFNDLEDSDFDDIERLGAMPELKRRPATDRPIQPEALPVTEEQCRKMYAAADLSFDAAAKKPIEKDRLRAYLEYQILPAIKKHLNFLGVDTHPKIQVVAPWSSSTAGITPIRYAPSDDFGTLLDTSLRNAREGELPCTVGQVPIAAFSSIFCHVAAMIDKSTTAHRRYKNRFTGEHIRLIFHPDYNHVEMFVPEDLADALGESAKCYLQGR